MDAKDRRGVQSLKEVERIKMLLKMLEWQGPDCSLTNYMVIEPTNEYKDRPVQGSLPPRFEVAEILDLQAMRDTARQKRN